MKVLKLLTTFLALALIAGACNKKTDTSTVSIKLAFGERNQSMAVEPGHGNNDGDTWYPEFSDVSVSVLDNSQNILEAYTYDTPAQLAQLIGEYGADGSQTKAPTGLKLQLPQAATALRVIANAHQYTITDVNDLQGFDAVPVWGQNSIANARSGSGTTSDPFLLDISIAPTMARFEIYGGINVNPTDNGVYAVDVEEIYINNIKLTKEAAMLTKVASDDWASTYASSGAFKSMFDAIAMEQGTGSYYATNHNVGVVDTKAASFNIFEQSTAETAQEKIAENMPHMVIKVKVYATEGDYPGSPMADHSYITVRNFKLSSAIGNFMTKCEAAKIYRLNLDDLSGFFKASGENPADPDPEMPKQTVSLNVTVLPWTVQNIYPVL